MKTPLYNPSHIVGDNEIKRLRFVTRSVEKKKKT